MLRLKAGHTLMIFYINSTPLDSFQDTDDDDDSEDSDVDCSSLSHEMSDNYENGKACWEDFKEHKKDCFACMKQDEGCSKYIA